MLFTLLSLTLQYKEWYRTITAYKITKKFAKITAICLISLFTIIGIGFILLNNSKIQQRIAHSASSFFNDFTGGSLTVGELKLRFPLAVQLRNVSLKAPDSTEIANFDALNAHINLFSLFRGAVDITSVSIDSLDANIVVSQDSALNIQFLIDAFTPQQQTTTPDLDFPSIALNGAKIRYSDSTNINNPRKGNFNPADILVSNLNTEISLTLRDQNKIHARVAYLNCHEKSGLAIDNISATLNINDTVLEANNCIVTLPNTYLRMDTASVKTIRGANGEIDWGESPIYASINNGKLHLPDLCAFAPELCRLREEAYISAKLIGKIGNMHISNLHARYGDVLAVRANMDASGLPDYENAFYYCNIQYIRFDKTSVQDLVANILGKPLNIPTDIANLGLCRYSGNISGFLSNMVLYGNLRTDIGSIKTDISVQAVNHLQDYKINGRIAGNDIQLHRILPKSGLGSVSFTTNAQIALGKNTALHGKANLKIKNITLKNYNYQNIQINGQFKQDQFAGKILMDDPNGYLAFDGTLSNENTYHNCEFTLDVKHFRPHKLNLTNSYPELDLSLALTSDFEGPEWENLSGFIAIDSLQIFNGEDKEYLLPRFIMEAHTDQNSSAQIRSDLINADIYGNYGIAALPNSLISIMSDHIPLLSNIKLSEKKRTSNDITFDINIEALKPLLTTIDIPWYTTQPSNIKGYLNTDTRSIRTSVDIPCVTNGKTSVDSIRLTIDNNEYINAILSLSTKVKGGRLNAGLALQAINDSIHLTVGADNHLPKKRLAVEIATITKLALKEGTDSLTAKINILPTEQILQDKKWRMYPGSVWSDFNKTIINSVGLESEDKQLIAIDGEISDNENEIINIALNDISLNYISDLIPEETAITFGGRVSGTASIEQILHQPRITANVHSEHFEFNEAYFGAVDASCHFDNPTTSLVFNGDVTADDGSNTANIGGSYSFPLDSLDLKGKANGLDIRFINYYTAPIFGKVAGKAYGDVHVYGITKTNKVAVDVAALAKDASITIDFLKNTFYFTDSIHIDRNSFNFGTINLKDRYGNDGTLQGAVYHNYFQNFIIDLNVKVQEMLVLNTTKADSESFYGTAYGTGQVRISGDERTLRITCKARSEAGSNIYIPIDSYYASENSFITFVDHTAKDTGETAQTETPITTETTTNIILDVMIDVTPSANVQILIDSKSGDMLLANGSGSLRITYDINNDDMKLYGTYQIEHGSYLFTFQNLLRKEFRIREGSSIVWTGDPLNANIDLNAYYQLTADLAEVLDESILSNAGRTSVPVQCLLNLSGILTQPNINFDLHLPNSDEELNRALKNTVNTEEQINRQIVSLLILNKFLSNDQIANNSVISQNELLSVVSSTLSSQLNNWASQMFNNWGFGVNFRTTGEGETRSNEYEFNFQYSPSKRWEISGNVGYRDDNMSSNPFIGDFDVTYELIESGKLQAKAYTHTNDYREFKKGLTTQGIGLVYSENFNSIPELIQSWKANAEKNKKERQIRRAKRKARNEARKAQREKEKREKLEHDKKENKKPDNETSHPTDTTAINTKEENIITDTQNQH